MEKINLTDKHFCYVIFSDMNPNDFIGLMKTNRIVEDLTYLDINRNIELYREAKELILLKDLGNESFEFNSDLEPFIFNKYINGKMERSYKICIFEHGKKENYIGKTSNLYCDGLPIFFDPEGEIIKNCLN